MNHSIVNTIYMAISFLLLFGSAELLYHVVKINAEVTRKYVHIMTGLLTMLFPFLIGDHWLVLALCSSFLLILLVSLPLKLLPSINAVERVTRGSILYPIIVYGCYLVFQQYDDPKFYYIPILILAISDPMAALVGRTWTKGSYKLFGHIKTLSGSLSFFISAVIICFFLIVLLENVKLDKALIQAVIIGTVTTITEAATHKGYDNLAIPAGALVALAILKELM